MKKVLIFTLALMCIVNVSVAGSRRSSRGGSYEHSLGFKVGSEVGLTYKGFILGVDGLALQADLEVKMEGSPYSETTKLGNITRNKDGYWGGFYTFEANPNVVYQKSVANMRNGSFDLYGGGGVSLGMAQTMFCMGAPIYGKFGINAAAGMEFVFSRFILGIDFKPGYGLAFNDTYYVASGFFGSDSYSQKVDSNIRNFFDWSLGMSFKWSL